METPYKKTVIYEFDVQGEHFGITHHDSTSFSVDEMRKNGQEDTHTGGEAILKDGKWEWDYESFSNYMDDDVAPAVLAYVQEHGLPQEPAVQP